jgi:hypothetical protein
MTAHSLWRSLCRCYGFGERFPCGAGERRLVVAIVFKLAKRHLARGRKAEFVV